MSKLKMLNTGAMKDRSGFRISGAPMTRKNKRKKSNPKLLVTRCEFIGGPFDGASMFLPDRQQAVRMIGDVRLSWYVRSGYNRFTFSHAVTLREGDET